MKDLLLSHLTNRTFLLGLGTAILALLSGFSFLTCLVAVGALVTALSGLGEAGDAYWDGLIDNFFDSLDDLELEDIKIGGTD